ncbi:MAG: ATP-binding protein [Actinobacteria bacterium]|nr:ATP-binding protein [Actinomycetota bacterium]
MEIEEFARLYQRFLQDVVHEAPQQDGPLVERLTEHLGIDPREVPVTAAAFAPFEHPDVQLALDHHLDGRATESFGVAGGPGRYHMATADLLGPARFPLGPVSYVEHPSGVDERLACIQFGVLLVGGDPPHAIVVRQEEHGPSPNLIVEVLSPDAAHGQGVLEELRRTMAARSVYRGKVFELTNPQGPFHRNVGATFLPRPDVPRDQIVLPDGTLERIERRTVGFDPVADRLAEQGLRRKRGLLLYGPPGTGKTLTARYLMGRSQDRTVIVLTGAGLGAISESATLARRLEPSMLVLEDVDLVAQNRSLSPHGNPLLFELLNELDGLGDDADVLVILTTNRADLLEPALAARPGRVDLAVELPLPDAPERRRLLERYTRDVSCEVEDWSRAVERTTGTPASFIEEVVRTAAVAAAQDGRDAFTSDDVDQALDELLESGPLTAALLGGPPTRTAPEDTHRGYA